jgi:hypothetical protein
MTNLPDFETCYAEASRLQLEKLTDASIKASQKKEIEEVIHDRFPYFLETNQPEVFGISQEEFDDCENKAKKFHKDQCGLLTFTFSDMMILAFIILFLGILQAISVYIFVIFCIFNYSIEHIVLSFLCGIIFEVSSKYNVKIIRIFWHIVVNERKFKNHMYLKEELASLLIQKYSNND